MGFMAALMPAMLIGFAGILIFLLILL